MPAVALLVPVLSPPRSEPSSSRSVCSSASTLMTPKVNDPESANCRMQSSYPRPSSVLPLTSRMKSPACNVLFAAGLSGRIEATFTPVCNHRRETAIQSQAAPGSKYNHRRETAIQSQAAPGSR